ncbi:MAG: MBL fold metallo-hydrolase [Opitutae bacterium]|nr:MBL fold metallo-hydrolase [Opitutae bacterium]
MKAIVQNNYGSPEVLALKEIALPTLTDDQILVRVHATSINAGDYFSLRGSPWVVRFMVGFPRPREYILGWDVAGRVEEVGSAVTQFRPGDAVFGAVSHAFAEYVAAPADKFAPLPANLTFGQAAAVPTAALTALQGLRDAGQLQPGQRVLINGAAGGVGTFAVQIARALGAEVTGVCSTRNVALVRALGASHVVDYTREDFTRSERRYDLILDNMGNRAFADLRRVLTPQGRIIPNSGHGGMGYVIKGFLLAPLLAQQEQPLMTTPNGKDLTVLAKLIEAGKVTPVIDRTFPFDAIPAALGYAAQGHTRGKVVITVQEDGAMAQTQRKAASGEGREIAPGIFWLEVGGGLDRSNVYFVQSQAGWVLIDAASRSCGLVIRNTAESLFGANTRPAAILLTHDHPDHAGSVRELVQLWDTPVYVHPDELPLIAVQDLATIETYANPLDRWVILPMLRIMPRRRVEAMLAGENLSDIVQVLDVGVAVPALPGWVCIPTPGHTPGHVAFFRRSDRVLLSGDALLTVDLNSVRGMASWMLRRSRQRVAGPPWYSTWNWRSAMVSIAALAALEPSVLGPGHGTPLAGAPLARQLQAFADQVAGRAANKRTRA